MKFADFEDLILTCAQERKPVEMEEHSWLGVLAETMSSSSIAKADCPACSHRTAEERASTSCGICAGAASSALMVIEAPAARIFRDADEAPEEEEFCLMWNSILGCYAIVPASERVAYVKWFVDERWRIFHEGRTGTGTIQPYPNSKRVFEFHKLLNIAGLMNRLRFRLPALIHPLAEIAGMAIKDDSSEKQSTKSIQLV